MKNYSQILILVFCFICSCGNQPRTDVKKVVSPDLPNIVLIVADDMGFSDLGCFGSEIATPNIDALARQGQILSNFYTAATCSPTRAMLLSGTDNHIAGLGDMAERSRSIPEEAGRPGYEGFLNDRVISVAQLVKDAGYHTYIAGKWHLGLTPEHSPKANGFEKSFTLMGAYADHFNPDPQYFPFWEGDGYTDYPAGEYSTNLHTEKLLGFLKEDRQDKKPFFLFAAYTSPHFPLQAPSNYIDKYKGVYDMGYDSLRILRFNRLKELGLVAKDVQLPRLPSVKGNLYDISNRPLPRWSSLDKNEKKIEARKMEIYAGMVDNLDYNVGRLINYLKEIGKYDNTLFVFFSDNGPDQLDLNDTPDEANPYPYMGTPNSFVAYGPQWAHASSAVNRFYKGYSAEGGIHSPLIIRMPFQKVGKGLQPAFATVKDMAPTFLEVAGANYPASYHGKKLSPHQGESWLPLLKGSSTQVHAEDYVMGWELFGRCALRKGKWKIYKIEPPFGMGAFELFNLEVDPTESHDLAKQFPEKYKEMLLLWNTYVKENGVILLDQ